MPGEVEPKDLMKGGEIGKKAQQGGGAKTRNKSNKTKKRGQQSRQQQQRRQQSRRQQQRRQQSRRQQSRRQQRRQTGGEFGGIVGSAGAGA